jgi:hypothetical protein
MADNQTTETLQTSQQAQKGGLLSHGARRTHATSSRYSLKDLKAILDVVQRVVCLGLAVWVVFHNNNVWEFITILAASQINPRGAKDILIRVFKGLVSEGK